MANINFTVSDEELASATKGRAQRFGPGNYSFTVVEASLMENSAWKGPKIKLLMMADHDNREFKIFDDLWLTESAKWKYARFVKSVGMDPTESIDTEDFLGKAGMFRLKKQKDSTYMEPGQYYTPEEASVEELGPFPPEEGLPATLAPDKEDDFPF